MTQDEARRAYQEEKAQEWKEDLERSKKELEEYHASEEHQRHVHEAQEKRWVEKAKREGWKYTPKPFVGALERQQMAEAEKQRLIAELEEKLKALKGN